MNTKLNMGVIEDKSITYSKLADDVVRSITAEITDSAPETLDTLNELAAALGDDPNFATTIVTELDKKANKEDLDNKADTTGYYPKLHVGLSDNLPDRGDVTEGFIGFRESAGSGNSIEDGAANVQELLGESLVWNQLRKIQDVSNGGITFTWDGDIVTASGVATLSYVSMCPLIPIQAGHVMLVMVDCLENPNAINFSIELMNLGVENKINITPTNKSGYGINKAAQTYNNGFGFVGFGGIGVDLTGIKLKATVHDLTKMFGAGHEPSTIEEFEAIKNQIVGVDFNAYNEGEVLGVNIKGIKSVNDNAWDEEWEIGAYSSINGNKQSASNYIRSKNKIKILPNTTYFYKCPTTYSNYGRFCFYDIQENFIGYTGTSSVLNKTFTTPSNAAYMVFWTGDLLSTPTYNHDICIRLSHSGYKTDYVPHEESESSFDLTPYFPNGLHGINGVRDSATPKKATRRIGVVDMGTLNWGYANNAGWGTGFYVRIAGGKNDNTKPCAITSRYNGVDANSFYSSNKSTDRIIAIEDGTTIRIHDNAYTDVASFKASLQGVILYYKLAEPIETEIDPQLNMNYKVWDFGTEELLTDSKSAPVLARTIYGFNATDTIRGNKATIENHEERITDLENEVVRVGDYQPDLTVGVADQLAGHEDATPSEIGFRRSGGGAILDGNARIEAIKGNSVVWNQLIPRNYKTTTYNGVTFTVNEDGSVVANGTASATAYIVLKNNFLTDASHKYAVFGTPSGGSPTTFYFGNGNAINDKEGNGSIMNGQGSTSTFACRVQSGITVTNAVYRPRLYDLTLMFGAGNEPTTIEEFYARKPLGIDEYAYNEGEVIHNATDKIESVGVNQWDEEWENGLLGSRGGNLYSATALRSKNYIRVLPNTTYFYRCAFKTGNGIAFYDKDKKFIAPLTGLTPNKAFVTPSNCEYIRFDVSSSYGGVYKGDICINLSDPSVNGKYFPYVKREQNLDIIGNYFPNGMKSAGTAHDEIRYNKVTQKWEYSKGKIKSVDMGTLNWSYQGVTDSYPYGFFGTNIKSDLLNKKFGGEVLCPIYPGGNFKTDKSILANSANNIVYVIDSASTDAASFKAAMAGVMLYYESNDWEWVELDEADQFKNLDYPVWNVGTENAIANVPSTPLKADIIYGFNAYGVIKELKDKTNQLAGKADISYVDSAITNAITITLNTEV